MSIKRIPDVDQLSAESTHVMRMLDEEGDLAVAIVGTSFLEDSLGMLLARRFVESSLVDRVLDPRSFLGTFSARADLAYLLALIPKPMYQDLDLVAQIRNRFAHSHLSVSFADPEVLALCDRLRFFDYFAEQSPDLDLKMVHTYFKESARNRLVVTVALIAGRLAARSRVFQNPPYDPQP